MRKKIDNGVRSIFKNEFLNINGSFILLLLVVVVSLCFKENRLETMIVSHPDSEIVYSTENTVLEQTWAPHIKNIVGISLPYITDTSFEGTVELSILSDDYNNRYITVQSTFDFIAGKEGEMVFEFQPCNVELGKRYRIQLKFIENSEAATIRIPTGSQYAGCSIDGIEQNEAIALKVNFEKNSRLFWCVCTYLPFLIFSIFIAIIFGRTIEETIGVSIIANILVLFLFGIIEKLEMGIYVIYVLCIFFFVMSMFLCNKRKIYLYKLFSPGLVLYGIGILFFMIICQDMFRKEWDEYSHWGLAVKDMFYYNAFAKHVGSSVFAKNYPPFSTLLEYFFSYTNEMFSEGMLYIAYMTLVFSLLIIIVKNIKWKNSKYCVSGVIIMLLGLFIFFPYIYTLYVDLLLAVLLSYVLICYFHERLSGFNVLRISLGLSALVLTKDMGLVLAGMLFLAILFDQIRICFINKKRGVKELLLNNFCFAIAVIVPFMIWQIYLLIPAKVPIISSAVGQNIVSNLSSSNSVSTSIKISGISFNGIYELLTMQAKPYKYQVIKNYFQSIFIGEMYTIGKVKISYIGILVFLNIIAWYFVRKKKQKQEILNLALWSIFIAGGYALFLLVTYLFTFTEAEAVALVSHIRYLASCIGGIFLAFWGLVFMEDTLVDKDKNKKELDVSILLVCTILVFTMPSELMLPQNMVAYVSEEMTLEYEKIAEKFRSFSDKNEAVYYICNNSNGIEQLVFANYVSPVKNAGIWSSDIYISDEKWQQEKEIIDAMTKTPILNGTRVTVEKWQQILESYDYVFLYRPAVVFAESYGVLFVEPDTIKSGALYKVKHNSKNTVYLEYMGNLKD